VNGHRNLEKYSTVFQTTSTVSGKIRQPYGSFDVIRACFPGGSITGCPKIRAMEIIEELEPVKRGIYTGCSGYIGFDGRVELNVIIRTAVRSGQNIFVQAGGGIVADSDPVMEYEETLLKAKALLGALR